MLQKIRAYILTLSAALMLAVPGLVPALASAASPGACSSNIANGIAQGANAAIGNSSTGTGNIDCGSSNVNDSSIGALAHKIVDIFSIIVGAVSVIMIIYGGFRYITSGGDSGRVGNAKNTLIYAILGLIIVALAQLIVHFVLNQANSAGT